MTDIKNIEWLDEPGALVIKTYPNKQVYEVISRKVSHIASQGEHILILKGASSQSINNIDYSNNPFLNQVYTADPFNGGFGYRCSTYQLIELLKNNSYDGWVSRIRLIIIESGSDVFYEPNVWETSFYLLRDKFAELKITTLPKLIVLAQPRHAIEPALKEALPLFDNLPQNETDLWKETHFNISGSEVKKHWWTIWTSCDSEDYFNTLNPNNDSFNIPVGIINPLAQFASRWGIEPENNLAVSTNRSGEKDRIENHKTYSNQDMYTTKDNISWQFVSKNKKFNGAVTTYNNNGNPWLTLKNLAFSFPDLTISNVIAKQTMMLEYMLANGHCFATEPILPFSPKIKRSTAYNTVLVLLQRLQHSQKLSLKSIGYLLSKIGTHPIGMDKSNYDTFGKFKDLVEAYFGNKVANQLVLNIDNIWNNEVQDYQNTGYVSIDESFINKNIEWLQQVEVRDGDSYYITVLRDHIFQSYWVGKQVLFYGKVFCVESIDPINNLINITSSNEARLLDYRLNHLIKINEAQNNWTRVSSMSNKTSYANGQIVLDSFVLDFTVHCGDQIVRSDSMWRNRPDIQHLEHESDARYSENYKPKFIDRRYKFGRALRILLLDEDGQSLLADSMAIALSAWLNESMVTMMPELNTFFISAPQLTNDSNRPKNKIIDICIPELNFINNSGENLSCVWIFEDSHTDLGIINTIFDNINYLLDLCYDWLQWYLIDSKINDDNLDKICLENISYPSSNWFNYGQVDNSDTVDLEGLLSAIAKLYEGTRKSRITQRRRRVEKYIQNYRLVDSDDGLIYECDICAKTIDDSQGSNVLSDGRISCIECHDIGVKNVEDVEKVYDEVVKGFYSTQYQINDFNNLNIKLVNQTAISRQQKTNFIPTSRFDVRTIGLAVSKGVVDSATSIDKSKYTVMLESGHSIENTAGTLVHELCHIWQYEHTNFEALNQEYGEYIIEGHAVWSEEAFLDYLGENPYSGFDSDRLAVARGGNERHKSSSSVYGKGYRLLIAKLGSKNNSAFKWVIKHFPKA